VSLEKAREFLKDAEMLFNNGSYNSCANRCYYSIFRASIAILEHLGFRQSEWTHKAITSKFGAELVKRRKILPSHIVAYIHQSFDLRVIADYKDGSVSKSRSGRMLNNAKEFVNLIGGIISK